MFRRSYPLMPVALIFSLMMAEASANAAKHGKPAPHTKPAPHSKDASVKDSHGAGHGKEHTPGHWGYEGAEGPAHWGSLEPAFALCKIGKTQTPVDLRPQAGAYRLPPLEFRYQTMPLNMVNNGHTGQMNTAPGSFLGAGLRQYELLQFHFHTPSEHVIKGKRFPMEVHFVHKSQEGTLAVVGVMFKEGKKNAAIESLWKNLPAKEGANMPAGMVFNPSALLPSQRAFIHYSPGSLTTPPCTEGLEWYVLQTPVEVSRDQIKAFHKIFGNNARPLQPLGSRSFMVGPK